MNALARLFALAVDLLLYRGGNLLCFAWEESLQEAHVW